MDKSRWLVRESRFDEASISIESTEQWRQRHVDDPGFAAASTTEQQHPADAAAQRQERSTREVLALRFWEVGTPLHFRFIHSLHVPSDQSHWRPLLQRQASFLAEFLSERCRPQRFTGLIHAFHPLHCHLWHHRASPTVWSFDGSSFIFEPFAESISGRVVTRQGAGFVVLCSTEQRRIAALRARVCRRSESVRSLAHVLSTFSVALPPASGKRNLIVTTEKAEDLLLVGHRNYRSTNRFVRKNAIIIGLPIEFFDSVPR